MDEAILIEIAQRFRALEDVAEGLERFRRRHDEMLIDTGFPDALAKLEKALEACRDDMVDMQEALRR